MAINKHLNWFGLDSTSFHYRRFIAWRDRINCACTIELCKTSRAIDRGHIHPRKSLSANDRLAHQTCNNLMAEKLYNRKLLKFF